jgi:hypothetical protein
VGELIAFKPARSGARLRLAPAEQATIVLFTGVWQERLADGEERPAKRGSQASRLGLKKSKHKQDTSRK